MRLSIKQCRWCNRNPKACEHAKEIRAGLSTVNVRGTVVHSCPIYKNMLPEGSLVEIELKEIDVDTYCDPYDPGNSGLTWEWVSRGMAQGHILGITRNRFYIIRLLEPVKLVLPPKDKGSYADSEEVEVEIRLKHLKDIKVIAPPPDDWGKEEDDIF